MSSREWDPVKCTKLICQRVIVCFNEFDKYLLVFCFSDKHACRPQHFCWNTTFFPLPFVLWSCLPPPSMCIKNTGFKLSHIFKGQLSNFEFLHVVINEVTNHASAMVKCLSTPFVNCKDCALLSSSQNLQNTGFYGERRIVYCQTHCGRFHTYEGT
ncbi:hypothetical protein KUF71_017333 [Frankliniella fusca]|uniref:Uncharacterized protein n=1 Tax=Frankliniella fusca TaxID=407009 RepID=A0AAE1I443_9NEOP|nr:hypothetical protein KUF71_017333 [Frankliniella fusca]